MGWQALCAHLPLRGKVLAIDGPQVLNWEGVAAAVVGQLRQRGADVAVLDIRERMASWERMRKRTASAGPLAGDPDFATIPGCTLTDFFDEVPTPPDADTCLVLVIGPGAALVAHDELWYADLPKRYAEAAVSRGEGRNLGQPADGGSPTTRRLFYVDWPLLDRHRELIGHLPEMFFDVQRLVLNAGARAPLGTDGRFHVLSVVEGEAATIRTRAVSGQWRRHQLSYAETLVIPAAVGHYEVTAATGARLVRAVVR